MPDAPYFTVVVSTFGRGPHIVPTIESLLGQTFTDFEALVVGDGVTDDTLDHVPRDDPRVRTINLPSHSGSQSAPNNAGISAALGRYVAYLGHDDIWMPDHLQALAEVLTGSGSDVAVSGCAFHGPPGTALVEITGLFEDARDTRRHFFPPTSFGHRISLAAEIGGWRNASEIVPPVDSDFLLRAVDAGARFVSTGRVTAHKFAAGHRYLGALDPTSDEQRDTLSAIRAGSIDGAACAALVARAKASGTFMRMVYPDFSLYQPGELYRLNRSNKGIERAAARPLTQEEYVPQTSEPRALDWYPPELTDPRDAPGRWSGPSLRPRMLIPFIGEGAARITLHFGNHDPAGIMDEMQITMNGRSIPHHARRDRLSEVDVQFTGLLRPDKPSVLQLILTRANSPPGPTARPDQMQPGVLLRGMTIAPVSNLRLTVDDFRRRFLQVRSKLRGWRSRR